MWTKTFFSTLHASRNFFQCSKKIKPILLLENIWERETGLSKAVSVNELVNTNYIELLSLNLFEYCRLIADNFEWHKNALCIMFVLLTIVATIPRKKPFSKQNNMNDANIFIELQHILPLWLLLPFDMFILRVEFLESDFFFLKFFKREMRLKVIKRKFANNRIRTNELLSIIISSARLICNETFQFFLAHSFPPVYSHWPSIF